MATTINYVVRKTPRKDGTFAVNIRIIHNREMRRLPTSVYLTKGQLSRDLNTIKDVKSVEIVQTRVMELRARLNEVSHADMMGIDQLVAIITRPTTECFRLDLFDFANKVTATMTERTAEGYTTALNAVKRFIGTDRLDINDITRAWVHRFRDFLENEPAVQGKGMTYKKKSRGSRAVSYYLGCIRHLHNQARMTYNDDEGGQVFIPRQPFLEKNIIPRQPLTEHRVLTVQQLRNIMEVELTPGSRAEMARDVFVLSFALAGTNAIDIYKVPRSSLKGDLLTFNRSKTERARQDRARITLKVLPEAMAIIKRYAGTEGATLMLFRQTYNTAKGFCHACNMGMKDVAVAAGIAESLTTYYARHSWATIARNICKVDFDTVNAGLNHMHRGADRIGDVYIARDYSAIWEAQAAVMDVVTTAAKQEKVPLKVANI